MELAFNIVSLPGNPINLTNYINIVPSTVYLTASNWSTEVVLLVDGQSAHSRLVTLSWNLLLKQLDRFAPRIKEHAAHVCSSGLL